MYPRSRRRAVGRRTAPGPVCTKCPIRRRGLVRRLLAFITVVLSARAVPATSSAQRAVHLDDAIDVSTSFQSPLLSGACGFPVTVTLSSPYGSFSFPGAATSVYTYPGGATLGSTADFHSSGLLRFGLVPGFGVSNAGIDIVAN